MDHETSTADSQNVVINTPEPFEVTTNPKTFLEFVSHMLYVPRQLLKDNSVFEYSEEQIIVRRTIISKFALPINNDSWEFHVDEDGQIEVDLSHEMFEKKIRFDKDLVIYVENKISIFELRDRTISVRLLLDIIATCWNGKRLFPSYDDLYLLIIEDKFPNRNMKIKDLGEEHTLNNSDYYYGHHVLEKLLESDVYVWKIYGHT